MKKKKIQSLSPEEVNKLDYEGLRNLVLYYLSTSHYDGEKEKWCNTDILQDFMEKLSYKV